MATLKSFEELEAWRMARLLTNEIYAVTSEGLFLRDYGLRDQIRRSGINNPKLDTRN
jgi:hypothetical protein